MDKLRPALTWLNELGPVLLGQVSLPKELVSGNPDDIAAGILDVVGYTAFRMQDEGDVSTITMLLGLAAALNAHTEGQLYDLSTARLAVGGFILAGKVQLARDIAEQVLRMSSTTPRRRRAGWSVFGDIYLRLGSTVEGLIGFACAAAGDSSVDADEVWLEASGLARLMRNLGLYDHAREMHDAAGRVLTRMGLWEANAHRAVDRLHGL